MLTLLDLALTMTVTHEEEPATWGLHPVAIAFVWFLIVFFVVGSISLAVSHP